MKYLVTLRMDSNNGRNHNIKKQVVEAENHAHAYLVASGRYQGRGIVLSTERRR